MVHLTTNGFTIIPGGLRTPRGPGLTSARRKRANGSLSRDRALPPHLSDTNTKHFYLNGLSKQHIPTSPRFDLPIGLRIRAGLCFMSGWGVPYFGQTAFVFAGSDLDLPSEGNQQSGNRRGLGGRLAVKFTLI